MQDPLHLRRRRLGWDDLSLDQIGCQRLHRKELFPDELRVDESSDGPDGEAVGPWFHYFMWRRLRRWGVRYPADQIWLQAKDAGSSLVRPEKEIKPLLIVFTRFSMGDDRGKLMKSAARCH